MHAERDTAGERAALERRVDLPLVEAVPELVHRPEEAAEVIREVPRRDADVGDPGSRRERMHRRVESPGVLGVAERLHDLELEQLLLVEPVVARARLVAALRGDLLDQRRLVLLQVVEDAAHFLRRHVALVVVEDDVVRLVLHVEAVDVALPEVEVLLEHGKERREVVRLPRLDPHRVGERRRPRHLGPQIGRHPARLLPVARRHADEARLEGVVVVALAPVAQLVEQRPDLRVDELRVGDPPDGRELLGADRGALRRHHHVLVPAQ